ncbi:MAG: alpha/beta hydrolase [Granulosicoccus sp.]
MCIDWDDAFDNTGYISGSALMAERWVSLSAEYRQAMLAKDCAELDLAYSDGPRNQYDLFKCEQSNNGLVVFIHGGYWHKLDRSYWSFIARGPLEHGWNVAIPSYTLAPEAPISHITQEVAKAITMAAQQLDGPIRLIGHSAGGHLVSRMLCDDSPLDTKILNRIEHVVPVSGVYDLRPLLQTKMNQTLRLNEQEAEQESPVLRAPKSNCSITLWVGCNERPEFLRQTRMMCETWQGQYEKIDAIYQAKKDHFSVIEDLADPESDIVAELIS